MSLPTLPTVQELQKALHAKAKESPAFRFYTLYDKIYRKDVLWCAWRRCLINGGARAVDFHARERLRQWLCRKHKVAGRGTARFPLQYGYKPLGLIELRVLRRRLPHANA